ncbi:hypothetical protein H2202_010948 [Exophiala xenobiotica]|nr:hypothetical protein H2202_010948 [Exophiala xenobiotica]
MSFVPGPPTLGQKYSGIPERLLDKATELKRQTYSLSTTDIVPRTTTGELPIIPKGYSRTRFNQAIQAVRSQIGEENVVLNTDSLNDDPNTHDAFHLIEQEELVSSATVFPGSTEEVVKVVKWANEYEIPIYPISMGRNLGYGGAAARVRGSVIVDLGKRMTKVLDIDPDACTCLVEPGVSFYALYEEIQRRGHTHLWIDVPDLGGGSVLGNTVDRGVGYTPYGDHFGSHSGMEVVLPTGEVIRTGMGALQGSNTWQIFPYGFGPYADGIFTQSNYGIVTKLGMTLMPNPGGSEGFMCTFREEEDLAQIIEVVRPLRIRNILENVAQLKHVVQEVALLGKPRSAWYQGKGQIPVKILREIASTLPCGDCSWVFYGTTYGPKEARSIKLKAIREAFEKVPGARWIPRESLPKDHYFFSREKISSGVPEFEELRWLNWHIAKKWHDECDLDSFPACCVGLREMYLIVNLVYNRGDPISKANAYRCMRGMIKDAAAEGFGEYRTHLLFQDQVAATYNWNNNSLLRFQELLKDSLDPNGILAPGRSGIWPKKYRGKGWELRGDDLESRTEGEECVLSTEPKPLEAQILNCPALTYLPGIKTTSLPFLRRVQKILTITRVEKMSLKKSLPFRRPFDPPEGYYVTHPNGQISHYHLDTFTDPWLPASKKPVIMFNHGCARTSEMWYHWVPRFSRDFVVIRRDNRGHGKSSFPKRLSPWSDQEHNEYEHNYQWDIDTLLEEIVDMLDQLGVEKVIFFGEATSGEVGHAFAAKYPSRITALITCSSPTALPPPAIEMLSVGERSWPEAVIKLGSKGWNLALAKNPGTLPQKSGYLDWLVDEAGKTHKEGLAGYVIFLTKLTSKSFLKDIKCPYLILAPTNSAAVPIGESEWIASQVPQAKLVKIEGPGHEIFAEAPDACMDATLKFLHELEIGTK